MNENLYKRVYNKACDYLAKREYSVLELYKKLSSYFNKMDLSEYDNDEDIAEIINNVLAELKSKDYLSNKRFADKFIESKLKMNQGPLLLQKKLRSKGITNELWLESWTKFEAMEPKRCHVALEKWLRKQDKSEIQHDQDKAKAVRFLSSRGFYQHTIYETLAGFEK